MRLTRLIYCSKTNPDFSDAAQIVTASQRNNAAHGITGALILKNGYFMQCLEGARAHVNTTYMRICEDARHTDPTILYFSEINVRYFAPWKMTVVPSDSTLARLNYYEFFPVAEFNPMLLNSQSANGLMKKLALVLM